MKKNCFSLILASFAALLSGCFEYKHIFWSPSGETAAVIGQKERLYFCDASGNLKGPLLENVWSVAWISDGECLVTWVEDFSDWNLLENALSPEERHLVKIRAEVRLKEMSDGKRPDWTRELADAAAKLFLRATQSEHLEKILPAADWEQIKTETVSFGFLQKYRWDGTVLSPGPVVARQHDGFFWETRIAPNKQAALVSIYQEGKDKSLQVALVSIGKPVPMNVLAEDGSIGVDWAPDGNSVAYIRALGKPEKSDEIQMGALTIREVRYTPEAITVAPKAKELAALLFAAESKVRWLTNGLILFSSLEVQLPSTGRDMPQREQLFWVRDENSSVSRAIPARYREELPQSLMSFEPSPDGRYISFARDDGAVGVFDFQSENLQMIQPAGEQPEEKRFSSVPVWRGPGELCFVQRYGNSNSPPGRIGELVLHNLNSGQRRILSKDWPEESIGFLKRKQK